jgi:hypothetical protein
MQLILPLALEADYMGSSMSLKICSWSTAALCALPLIPLDTIFRRLVQTLLNI